MSTVPKLVGNFGNRSKVDLGYSQPRICWEFVKFVTSGWESTQKCIVQENDSHNISDISKKKWTSKVWEGTL